MVRQIIVVVAVTCFSACSDDSTPEVSGATDDASETRVGDLTAAEIEDTCAGFVAQGEVTCASADGSTETINDRFDSTKCEEVLESLKQDWACLLVSNFETCMNLPVCERAGCELACPEAELCETYSVAECEEQGEGVCHVRQGLTADAEGSPMEGPAYCTRPYQGCDDAIQNLSAPDGTCWKFTQTCSAPADWDEVASCGF